MPNKANIRLNYDCIMSCYIHYHRHYALYTTHYTSTIAVLHALAISINVLSANAHFHLRFRSVQNRFLYCNLSDKSVPENA